MLLQTRWPLLLIGVALLQGCSPQVPESLTPRSNQLIYQLQEWYLTGEPINSPTKPIDTLSWFKENDTFYSIVAAVNSTFRYDTDRRVVQQLTNGYRNTVGFGRTYSSHQYNYSYLPNQLTIVRQGRRFSDAFVYDTIAQQQTIALSGKGLASQLPRFDDAFSSNDNFYSGISQLLIASFHHLPSVDKRTYNAEGYLIEASQSQDKLMINQTIDHDNVVENKLYPLGSGATGSPLSRWINAYESGRANIPNPYQFLGTSSRNLLSKALVYDQNRPTPYSQLYGYEYDAKGRVKRYRIQLDVEGKQSLQTVGLITYQDE